MVVRVRRRSRCVLKYVWYMLGFGGYCASRWKREREWRCAVLLAWCRCSISDYDADSLVDTTLDPERPNFTASPCRVPVGVICISMNPRTRKSDLDVGVRLDITLKIACNRKNVLVPCLETRENNFEE